MDEPIDPWPAPPKLKSKLEWPLRHCCGCGKELGRYRDYDPSDNCGQTECQREANAMAREERREAHEKLDRDMGWSE
jgi:hypothetical protein